MGGLLAAESANSPSSQSERVIGMVAFDTPFLGMLFIGRIAYLSPRDEAEPPKTEHELNPTGPVKMVDPRLADDWDAEDASFKGTFPNSPHGFHLTLNAISPSPYSTPSRTPSPILAITPTPFADTINNFLDNTSSFMTKHSDDKIAKRFQKHCKEPFTAMYRWVVLHFLFGICTEMVIFWTETDPCAPMKHDGDAKPGGEQHPPPNVDHALPPNTADFALPIENEASYSLQPCRSSTSSSNSNSSRPPTEIVKKSTSPPKRAQETTRARKA
ncbi:hypothetical protein BD410DRAFT_843931 [Rickenella mellea]|uniref:Uncharacterized protein n=1 Tax=Rickenella mellea TaxID=50990 RepID=A0A4Y7PPT6_9AGAM|nr:hypothetical protein BD410DRAFT_843931 [Rickenella mellea]